MAHLQVTANPYKMKVTSIDRAEIRYHAEEGSRCDKLCDVAIIQGNSTSFLEGLDLIRRDVADRIVEVINNAKDNSDYEPKIPDGSARYLSFVDDYGNTVYTEEQVEQTVKLIRNLITRLEDLASEYEILSDYPQVNADELNFAVWDPLTNSSYWIK